MRTITPRLSLGVVLLALLGTNPPPVHADQWLGFRGLEREGVSESSDAVSEWGPDKNVQWKTEIPGEGHSSPVVTEDRVYVTTAFLTETRTGGKAVLRYAVYGLGAVLGGLALIAMMRSSGSQSLWQFAALVVFCFVMGIAFSELVAAQVYADAYDVWGNYKRWIVTGCISSMLLMLAGVLFTENPWLRVSVGIVAIALSAVMLFHRPEPTYYGIFDSEGNLGYFAKRVLMSTAVPAVAGGLLILGAAFAAVVRRRAAEPTEPTPTHQMSPIRSVLLVAALALGVLTPLYAFRLLEMARTGEDIGPDVAITGWRHVIMGTCLFLLLGAFAMLPRPRTGSSRLATWLGIGFACLAIGVFVERNYVLAGKEFVRAIVSLDRDDGEIKWIAKALGGPQKRVDKLNSQASPTAVVDDERVYAYFGSAGLMCTDLKGKMIWTNQELPLEGIHGVAGSPLLFDGVLVIANEGGEYSYIVGLDAETGEQIWKKQLESELGSAGNYRTPLLKSFKGRTQVIVWGWNDLRSFDLYNGDLLWKSDIEPELHEPVASIVSDEENLYLATKGAVRGFSLPLCEAGDDAIIWESRGGGPETASPVRVNDLLFVVTDQGIVTCFDTADGKKIWRKRIASGEYLASMIAAGENVYAFTDEGIGTVFAAERKFRKIAENDLQEEIFASPAPVDGQLFVRSKANLWCFEEP